MNAEYLTKIETKKTWNTWTSSHALPDIGSDYLALRHALKEEYDKLKEAKYTKYDLDARYAIAIYKLLAERGLSTLRNMADDGFWRYLSLNVIPHVIADRWDGDKADHFFQKPNRNYPKSLWWFVYLCWQGTEDETMSYITSKEFSTDTIVALVERSGHFGTNIELYRTLMTKYRSCRIRGEKAFRKLMMLNTVRSSVTEPALYEGGIEGYVDSIIAELGLR